MGRISVIVVKPDRDMIARRALKANDRAWKEAMFGIAGQSRRIGGARLGAIGNNSVSIITELPEVTDPATAIWTFRGDNGPFVFAGPAILFNDAGFGPADMGVSIVEIRRRILFNPTPKAISDAFIHMRERKDRENA